MPVAGSTYKNGVEVTAGVAEGVLIAANPDREGVIVQNTGAARARVGLTGVTAVTGIVEIPPDDVVTLHTTQALQCIRSDATDTTLLVSEYT